ncbi:MAG: DUF4350 domain-containing protein [Calditrichota bacterium]
MPTQALRFANWIRRPVIALAVSILLGLQPASPVWSGNVVWDVSHNPLNGYHPGAEYRLLADLLAQNGWTVTPGNVPVQRLGLWEADILVVSVLSNYESAYAEAEVERIISFVRGGGGLIVLADNSQSRPDNLIPLLEPFGLLASQGDDLQEPVRRNQHPLFEGVRNIAFDAGGAVAVVNGGGGEIIASDTMGLGAVAVNTERGGRVVLIGDADVWINDIIEMGDNAVFALNAFRWTDRVRQGRIVLEGELNDIWIVEGLSVQRSLWLSNSGEGLLEFGASSQSPLHSIEPRYGVITPNEHQELLLTLNADAVEEGDQGQAFFQIDHNAPDQEPLLLTANIHILPDLPEHFEIPAPTGSDHSLLIAGLTVAGEPVDHGVEVGVFNEDGICGGGAVYIGNPTGISVRADDLMTEEVEGFVPGQSFIFHLFVPWEEREIGALTTYLEGPDFFRVDALTLIRLDGRPQNTQRLNLHRRWNLISLNVRPANLDFTEILAPLVEANLLLMVKDDSGRFWNLEHNFNNLQGWSLTKGYQVLVAEEAELEVEGLELPYDMPIPLTLGWSMIPYLPAAPQSAEAALAGISDNLTIAKQDDGSFYLPAFEYNGIGDLEPGKGYQVKMTAEMELVYPAPEEGVDAEALGYRQAPGIRSGPNMSVYIDGLEPGGSVLITSPEGVINSEATVNPRGQVGLAVWGDDPTTTGPGRLREGQAFQVWLDNGMNISQFDVQWIQGDTHYSEDNLAVGRANYPILNQVRRASRRPPDISLSPNPFNERLAVIFNCRWNENISIKAVDISGRTVESKFFIQRGNASTDRISLNTNGWPSGVLFIQIDNGGVKRNIKAIHLR